MMQNWVAIGSLNDIPRRGARCVKNGEMTIAVFRTADDKVYALEDKCPHRNGPLSQGIVHDGCVTCPLHNWVVSLETGEAGEEDGVGAEGKLSHDMLLTDPEQAKDFVARTNVDALAIAIGTSHGAYKFTRKPTGEVLAMTVIEAINKKLPDTHLVMHGSSSVPQDLLEIINEFGGEIRETYGVPVEEIVRGIKHGVRKVNIDTDLRLASTAAIRKVFGTKPGEFDPRKYLKPAMEAMQKVCEDRFEAFGTAGNASKIKPIPAADMAKRYVSGELDPKTA